MGITESIQLMNTLVTMVVGVVTGVLTTLTTQAIAGWWKRPILSILFDEDEEGCQIETIYAGTKDVVGRYLRLKILNRGKSTAKDVSVSIINLIYQAPGKEPIPFGEEVIDLKLASRENQIVFRLASGAHQYVDLLHTVKIDGSVALIFDFVDPPIRLRKLGLKQGTYSAKVFVAADNAASTNDNICWTWDGQYEGLRIATT
jgi:hypothetical protein